MKRSWSRRGRRAAWIVGLICAVTMATKSLNAQTAQFSFAQSTIGSGLNGPSGVAVDGSGNIYIADNGNNRVLKETPNGSSYTQTTIDTGLNFPLGVAVDGSGNVYVADANNSRVLKETPNGSSYTQSTIGSSLIFPSGVAVDGSGDVYVADQLNKCVLKETPSNGIYIQSTVVSGQIMPYGVAVDGSGNVYFSDPNDNSVLKETPSGGGYTQSAIIGGLNFPGDVAVDGSGNVYISEDSNLVVKETLSGSGYTQSAIGSGLNSPNGVAVDSSGNLYISDWNNNRELKEQLGAVSFDAVSVGSSSTAISLVFTFNTAGTIAAPAVLTQGAAGLDFADAGTGSCTTAAVNATSFNAGDTCTVNVTFTPKYSGPREGAVELMNSSGAVIATAYVYGTGTGSQIAYGSGVPSTLLTGLSSPVGVAVDGTGAVFAADSNNNRVIKISPNGSSVTVVSGLNAPDGIAVDGADNLYIANFWGSDVLKVTPNGAQTMVGSGWGHPYGIAVDAAGNVFVGDASTESVVKVTADGAQTTVASGFDNFTGIAVDGIGNLFVADYDAGRVFKISPTLVRTTVGSGWSTPTFVAVDGAGDVFVTDANSSKLQMLAPDGTQRVLASGLSFPYGVAVDATGNIFVVQLGNGHIAELQRSQPSALTFASTAVGATSSDSPQSVTIQNIGNAPLTMSGLSIAANFGQVDGAGNPEDCTASLSLAAGAECNLSLSFTPTTAGSISGSVVLSDNVLNGNPATQTINLAGTATDTLASFSIAGLVNTTAGTGENFTITALDSKGNVDTSFSGTISLSSSDPQGGGTNSVTLTNGVKTLSDAWKFLTVGSQTLTVTDSADSIVSTSAPVLITAGPASSMAIVQGSGQSATVNTAFATPLQVVVKDQFGNIVSGATVTFTAQSIAASAALSAPAVTAADGTTSVTATANATAGSYNVNVTSTRLPSVRFALTNTLASQTITFPQPASPISYSSGLAVTLNATASSTLAVTYSVVSGPATVSGSTLTITGAGTVVVEADQTGNSTYAAATAVRDSIVVSPVSQTVNITGLPATATYGAGPYTLSATSTSGSTPTFSVTGPASISGSTLTITGTGNVVVTASVTASANYAAASASQTIVVSAASQTITFANPGAQNFGTHPTLTATASSGLAVNFTSITTGICTITSGGALTFGTAGTCTIHADQAGDSNHAAAPTVSQSFTVDAVIPGTPTIGTATAGNGQATVSFTAPMSSGGAAISAYTVISSPGGVVGAGSSSPITLTGLTNGTAYTFTVNAINSAGTSAASAVSNSVTPIGSQTISFTGLPTTATYGAAVPYTLNATATSDLPVSYSVSGPATVSGNILTINGAGTILVTASQAGNAGYTAAASVSQTIVVSAASQTITFTGLPSKATYGSAGPYTLSATSTSGSTPTFSVTGPATVSGNVLIITGAGNVVVTASVAASTNYTAASASQTIVVSAASQTVNFTGLPSTATYGSAGPYTLSATSTSGSTPTFSATGPETLSGNVLTITGAGTVNVIASVAASANYGAASSSLSIAISQASQSITFTGLPTTATYGSAGLYTLNGTATSGLAVSYSVTGPATVAGNTLTITGAGTVIVTASQAGNGNYKAAISASQTIVIGNPTSIYDAAITLQYASTQLVYPGATNITVCIAPAHNITATGSVQIYDGTTLLTTLSVQGGGCAYWYISPGLAAGDHVLTAVYSGDKNNPGGTSAPTTIHVAPVPVNMAPSCWLTNSGYGANYQCTVSLSSNAGSAQGVMTYSFDGGTAVSVVINNGTANFTLTRPAAGNHTVQIAYAQQTNYAAAGPVTENFTVASAQVQVALTPSSWYTSKSAGISFAAVVNSSSAGAPSSNGSVEFFDGTSLLATVPVNANGQASYSTTKLAAGSHTIAATYSGGVNYASGSSSVTIRLTP